MDDNAKRFMELMLDETTATAMMVKLRALGPKPSPPLWEAAIADAFDELLPNLRPGSFKNLIRSFQKQWWQAGRLSDRQRQILEATVHRSRVGGGDPRSDPGKK